MKLWPPINAPPDLIELVNPTAHNLLSIDAASDERSVIYMSGSTKRGENKPIILINFDPATRFAGLPQLEAVSTSNAMPGVRRRTYQEVSELPAYQASAFQKDRRGQMRRFREQRAMWRELNHGYQIPRCIR